MTHRRVGATHHPSRAPAPRVGQGSRPDSMNHFRTGRRSSDPVRGHASRWARVSRPRPLDRPTGLPVPLPSVSTMAAVLHAPEGGDIGFPWRGASSWPPRDHLDHDLGGEVFVDHERDDCGMAVVRWLCAQPRLHLKTTRFFVHTHNLNAACLMVLQLQLMGYDVQVRPFGAVRAQSARPGWLRMLARRVIRWLMNGGDQPLAPAETQIRDGSSERMETNEIKPNGL